MKNVVGLSISESNSDTSNSDNNISDSSNSDSSNIDSNTSDSTFGKRNSTHLTTDVMFSGQRFAILAMFK